MITECDVKEMSKHIGFAQVSEQSITRFRLLAVSLRKRNSDLFEDMVNDWWLRYSDKIPVDGKVKKAIKKVIQRRRTPI